MRIEELFFKLRESYLLPKEFFFIGVQFANIYPHSMWSRLEIVPLLLPLPVAHMHSLSLKIERDLF